MSEILGTIRTINATQQVSASFKKRELVITTSEQFPQTILVEMNQDKCDLLNNYKVGDSVKVDYNLRGRIWVNPHGEEKVFNTIQAWKITKTEQSNSEVENHKKPHLNNDEAQDLPF